MGDGEPLRSLHSTPVSKSRKQALREFLVSRQITGIGEPEWQAALRELAPISESYSRDLLRATGLPFAQPYAGIRQHTFAELESDLRAMLEVYTAAMQAGDRPRASYCRRQVIAAKDRARFAARHPKTPPAKKAQKEEMAQWLLVWLENPEVFPAWAEIRKRLLQLD
ncbi:MAG TPA: hypothetical protein VMU80_09350 [Bryobacteraceae bacterium]|nr:hypothetical protein [Bryobacteraceae bacterium]